MNPQSSVVFFPCMNMEETREYYSKVLELPIYKDLGNTVWFDCGYGYIAFVYYGPDRAPAAGQCISFNLPTVEDVDEAYRWLQGRDVIGLKAPPAHHPKFPVYSFFFSDPNGYVLEIQRTTD